MPIGGKLNLKGVVLPSDAKREKKKCVAARSPRGALCRAGRRAASRAVLTTAAQSHRLRCRCGPQEEEDEEAVGGGLGLCPSGGEEYKDVRGTRGVALCARHGKEPDASDVHCRRRCSPPSRGASALAWTARARRQPARYGAVGCGWCRATFSGLTSRPRRSRRKPWNFA
eukprot:scaffold4409_cov369-Prasinococcus_capsulatus_cf.AAC.9